MRFRSFSRKRNINTLVTVTVTVDANRKYGTKQRCINTEWLICGTWYLPHSHAHNERTVPIIMAGCMAHARKGYISTSGVKSDVTIVFRDPNFS